MTTPTFIQTLDAALKYAVEEKNLTLVAAIFAQGTPSNLKITECLTLAMEHKSSNIVEFLIKKIEPTTSPNGPAQGPTPGLTPFRPLVVTDRVKQMDGATNLSSKKNSGLMLAFADGSAHVLQLLESGTISLEELDYQNDIGWTVLHFAANIALTFDVGPKLVNKILELGANVNLKTNTGLTALMMCFISESSTDATVESLLKHPMIDVNAVASNGKTALMFGMTTGGILYKKRLEMLLKHVSTLQSPGLLPAMKNAYAKPSQEHSLLELLDLYFNYHKANHTFTFTTNGMGPENLKLLCQLFAKTSNVTVT